jgi:hypothetical protein
MAKSTISYESYDFYLVFAFLGNLYCDWSLNLTISGWDSEYTYRADGMRVKEGQLFQWGNKPNLLRRADVGGGRF